MATFVPNFQSFQGFAKRSLKEAGEKTSSITENPKPPIIMVKPMTTCNKREPLISVSYNPLVYKLNPALQKAEIA